MKPALLLCTAICITALTFSCVSVPVPRDEDDSLVIIQVEEQRDGDFQDFGQWKLKIEGNSPGIEEVKQYRQIHGSQYVYLSDLPPGTYSGHIYFLWNNGKPDANTKYAFKFTVEKGKAKILDNKIVISTKVEIISEYQKKLIMGRSLERLYGSELIETREYLISQHPELSAWNWF